MVLLDPVFNPIDVDNENPFAPPPAPWVNLATTGPVKPPVSFPPKPPQAGTGTPAPAGGGGVTSFGGSNVPDFGTFEIPQYGGSMTPNFNFSPVPQFNGPDWMAPTADQAMNEPGYQVRLRAGMDALQNSASARGSLLTGDTLQDLVAYNQNFATQEYGGTFDRAMRGFETQYRGAKDEYAPQFADWQFRNQAEKDRAFEAFQREYDVWALGLDANLRREGIGAGIAMPQMPSFLG